MMIIPAIDIMNNKPVRLYQGDYNQKEIVAKDIMSTAKSFEEQGAKMLHLVDLDGAKEGKIVNGEAIIGVARELKCSVEVGGGIRSMEDIDYYLRNGVARIIMGTSALENPKFVKEALETYGAEKIVIGVDAKNNKVYGHGWLEDSDKVIDNFLKELEDLGVKRVIVTDISKDGTLSGPNIELLKRLKSEVKIDIIASGGMSEMKDVEDLKAADVSAVIIGKALYHGTIDLKEAIKVGEA